MSSENLNLKRLLAAAEARIEHGNREIAAGADDKARAIDEECERRGHGGGREVAAELDVSETVISQARKRARRAQDPVRSLPWDTLERLLAAEVATLPPLPAAHWRALAFIVRGTIIDVSWFEQPGELLAGEVEDSDHLEEPELAALAETCRALSPGQSLAVIDACQRDDIAALPVKE